MNDAALARRIATVAGELLLTLQRSALFEGHALGRAGDEVANAFILQALAAARPDDAVLSEEAADDLARLERRRVWIVDPLDGTREYGEARHDWAVHVALAVDGVATEGAVALPALGLTLATDEPPPSASRPPPPRGEETGRRRWSPPPPLGEGDPEGVEGAGPGSTASRRASAAGAPRMVVSRTRPPAVAVAVAQALGAELVPMGSAGAKAMAVVRGEAEIYLHAGGQYEWDNCAPVAVAVAAGLHASRIDGAPMRYNRAETYTPDLLICRPEYARAALAEVAAFKTT